MDAQAEAERALMEGMRNLLREAAAQFAAQFDAARGEIGRVQSLLADAIEDLTHSFHGMHAGDGSCDGLVGKAITALQFQDMVSQLLAHVTLRVDALDAVMRDLDGLAGALDRDAATDDLPAAVAAVGALQGKIAAALRGIETQTLNNPVGQRSMAGGDIELF